MSDYGSTPPPPPPGGGYGTPPAGGGYGAMPPGGGYGAVPPMGGQPPNNNLVLAIVSLLCCWPLGIPAVVFAAQVNGKWHSGDQAGAIDSAAKAKKFATIALVLGVIGMVFYGILIAMGAISSSNSSL